MIRGDQLTIGDYVLVQSKIRRVESITKKKIGFHIHEDKKRLYYARLCEVFPIEIKELRIEGLNIYINNDITLEFKFGDFEIENFHHTIKVSNCFDERLILREWHLHLLQHIFKALDIKYTINIKK